MKKALAFTALALVFLFVTGFETTSQLASQLTTIQFQLVNLNTQISGLEAQVASLEAKTKEAKTEGPREFYLTQTGHTGATALSACAPGYHMASLWEIHEPTQLRYNTELGVTRTDSGFGPPAPADGWIRTGGVSFAHETPGVGNCSSWTTSSVQSFGTFVSLAFEWSRLPDNIVDPWLANSRPCNGSLPVWCVQD